MSTPPALSELPLSRRALLAGGLGLLALPAWAQDCEPRLEQIRRDLRSKKYLGASLEAQRYIDTSGCEPAPALLLQADCLYSLGLYWCSLRGYSQGLLGRPESMQAWDRLARVASYFGDETHVLRLLGPEGLELANGLAGAPPLLCWQLGVAAERSGDLDTASEQYARAGDHPSAALRWARLLEANGQTADAEQARADALASGPRDHWQGAIETLALEQARALARRGEFPGAHAALDRIAKDSPWRGAAGVARAELFLAEGEAKAARGLLKAGWWKGVPAHPERWALLSQAEETLGKKDRSAEYASNLDSALAELDAVAADFKPRAESLMQDRLLLDLPTLSAHNCLEHAREEPKKIGAQKSLWRTTPGEALNAFLDQEEAPLEAHFEACLAETVAQTRAEWVAQREALAAG